VLKLEAKIKRLIKSGIFKFRVRFRVGFGFVIVGIPYNRWFRGATLWVERLRELRFVLVK
jgi:hypothetical protein